MQIITKHIFNKYLLNNKNERKKLKLYRGLVNTASETSGYV